ncbi:alanine racemase [Desulfovibrio sp. OttesenSCG-928-G15]|nr:alanine racemase [Desulfovibrio sp. OttesenSCG-928-G15]
MFLQPLLERNAPLAAFALDSLRRKLLLPDTFIIDLDTLEENASLMLAEAKRHGISLYFMLKQLGRIPAVGALLAKLGYAGAVCVDFREALTMLESGVPLGNVGHLVQTPKAALEKILAAKPEIVTVYSVEKAREIGAVCSQLGLEQHVMLRVSAPDDILYPGQQGGFSLELFARSVKELAAIKGIRPAGVCAFPCFLFNDEAKDILPTPNLDTVQKAAAIMGEMGYADIQVNLPSVSCVRSLGLIAAKGGTHAEPGHALTGTTPYHALPQGGPERPALAYLSEISHNCNGKALCYGGGHYRRGHLAQALVGDSLKTAVPYNVSCPSPESIDYHFMLDRPAPVSQGALMCFRSQVFVTRSEVALASGLSRGKGRIESIWSAQGHRLAR